MFTTPELLYILQHCHKYGENKLMIETSESETEFGTKHYSFHLYYKQQVANEMHGVDDAVLRHVEFADSGIIALLDFDCVITSNDFGEALRQMLEYQHKNKYLL